MYAYPSLSRTLILNLRLLRARMSDFNPSETTIRAHIREISRRPTLIQILSASIFPEIMGHLKIKEALLYQLVSGGKLQLEENLTQDNINILLVGDPGTGKTQILSHVSDVTEQIGQSILGCKKCQLAPTNLGYSGSMLLMDNLHKRTHPLFLVSPRFYFY